MGTRSLKIPDGFVLHKRGRVRLLFDVDTVPDESLECFENLPALLGRLPAKTSRSRHMGTVWELPPQSWFSGTLVARQYVHGGLFGDLTGPLRTLFLDPAPMTNELRIAVHLSACGVPASRPMVLRLENRCGPFFNAILVSEKIPGAINLLQLSRLGLQGELNLSASSRANLLEGVAGVIADMHESRVCHGDLNLKNMLVRASDDRIDKVYIIDFKKATLCDEAVSLRKGLSNIHRLWRSVEKWPESADFFRPEDRSMLVKLYRNAREMYG